MTEDEMVGWHHRPDELVMDRETWPQGNPDPDPNDETRECTCARMCVGALKMFVFVNNFYYSHVP